jgi:endonuclease/exonuclease/phosphatase family metal-dependent hydrolase
VATLERLQPDVLCLQEVWAAGEVTHADELAGRLGLHSVFCRTRMPDVEPESGADGLGIAVLGRWPVLRARQYPLTDGPRGRGEREPSVALLVSFDHSSGPLHVATACPDWDVDRGDARLAQTTALAELLSDPLLDGAAPVVLAADLNARPNTQEFRALTNVLTDAWASVHPGDDGWTFTTGNRFVGSGEWLADGRIDHILFRSGSYDHPVTVRAAALAGTEDPPPSDHYAIAADLQW